jgi:hypothetical protein
MYVHNNGITRVFLYKIMIRVFMYTIMVLHVYVRKQ